LAIALDPRETAGFAWAVPLWSERGQIGLLLLGEKSDGGFYSQEEMEIARASGERLVDAAAGAEIARRLIVLQRERLAESQVLDRQTRRVLHDDVLPLLHTALLSLNRGGGAATPEASQALTQAHREISNLLRDIPPSSSPEVARLGLLGALQQMVNGEFSGAFDRVEWQVDESSGAAAKGLRPLPAQVLYYAAREAVRNAARYGRQLHGAPLVLKIALAWQDGLLLQVQDNGGSYPSSGAAQTAGSGQGLALHSTMMAVVGGTLTLESQPGVMTRVSLFLPPGAC
jgi:signal transduction histidine kinase